MEKMYVRNMTSPRSGREVANQFIITTERAEAFQSYSTVIVLRENGKTFLDRNSWDCSMTTGKYRNQYLGETKKETERKIKEGIYELADLN